MDITADEIRAALVEEHTKLSLAPKFNIDDYGDGNFSIAITLKDKSWNNQSTSIDAMLAMRERFFGVASFDYFYTS